MDTNLLLIIIISSVLFVGILVWKFIWFYKKVIRVELEDNGGEN